MTDDELLQAWAAGDRGAAAPLIERYSPMLLRFFRGKAPAEAEDLVQRTFLDCVQSQPERLEASTFRAFMFTVARNRLYDHLRRGLTRGQALDPDHVSLVDLATSLPTVIDRQERERVLLDALWRLPMNDQLLLEFFYWENLSGQEISDVLDIPEGTVRGRLRAAKGRLRALMDSTRLDDNGVDARGSFETWAEHLRGDE